jgi:hypothetical protein
MTYTWNIAGASATSTANTYSKALTTAGNNTYTASVKNSNGCVSTTTAAQTVVVNALPTISATSVAARCGSGAVTLTATASGTTTAMTYTWIVGGAAAVTTTTGSYTPATLTASTTYSVTLKYANNCTTPAATGTITVDTSPLLSVTINAVADAGCPSNMVTYNLVAGTATGYTYQWMRNGSAISGATDASLRSSENGTFTCLATKTSGSCSIMSNQKVTRDITCGAGSCTHCNNDPGYNMCCKNGNTAEEAQSELVASLKRNYCQYTIVKFYQPDPTNPPNVGWGVYFTWCKMAYNYKKAVN